MLEERLDGGRAAKAHGMVQRRNSVLVGGMNVGAVSEQLQKPPPLIGRVWIALAANLKQLVPRQ